MTTGIQRRANPGRNDPHAQAGRPAQAGRFPGAREGADAMTEITIRTRPGLAAWISFWVRGRQRELSALVYTAGDERARQYGWEVMESTGRFGFGARTYRDPRFN